LSRGLRTSPCQSQSASICSRVGTGPMAPVWHAQPRMKPIPRAVCTLDPSTAHAQPGAGVAAMVRPVKAAWPLDRPGFCAFIGTVMIRKPTRFKPEIQMPITGHRGRPVPVAQPAVYGDDQEADQDEARLRMEAITRSIGVLSP
jgi:hypothetical protein